MEIQPLQLPNQKLTEAEKIKIYGSVEEWAKQTTQTLIGIGAQTHYLSYDDTYRKQINYNLVSGYVNPDDFNHVVKPFGLTKFNFPATFTNYNIITPKISLLEGEEANRPFNFRAVATGSDDTNVLLRQKTSTLKQLFKQNWLAELQASGVDVENEQLVQQSTPDEVNKYFQYDYKVAKEIDAQNALEFLQKYCDLKDKFQTGWRDLLITGEEVYWVGIRSGEPIVDLINPVYFHYDRNPDLKYIEDAAWAFTEYFMPPADVYDRYYDVLTNEQVERIELMKGGQAGNTVHSTAIGIPIRYTDKDDGLGSANPYIMNSSVFVHVVHIEWKSLSKIGFVSWVDENGQAQEIMVDEHYKRNPFNNETIEWRWINTVWEATRIGDDIFVNVRPKPNQYRNMDNPSKCKLGYVGLIYNARNSQPYSLVEVMKPHQYLYDIIMYRLELEIARAQGKKMVFDVAQIPRTEGFDMDRWLYYFNILGVAFINSFEEGKGKFAGQRPQFNQFTQIDMSLARVIDQYVQILSKIEEMVGEISGVSRQRQGEISSSETVGGVERSVKQSNAITEPLFFAHNQCKQHVLTSLLEAAKLAWVEGKKVNYVMDDMTRLLVDIDGTEFCNSEFGIFVSDNANDEQIFQSIKQLAQYAMSSNQASLKDIIGILKSKNIAKAEQILENAAERAQQAMQQQQQYEQEMQQQQLEAENQRHQGDLAANDTISQRQSDTAIQVALINSESKVGMDPDTEASLEALKIENERKLKARKMQDDSQIANRKLDIDSRNNDRKLEDDRNAVEKQLAADKAAEQKRMSDQKAVEDKKLKDQRDLENKRLNAEKLAKQKELELEREIANKEHNLAKNIADKELAQDDLQHQREQETKIATEKIKAKAQKDKPKPKSSGS